MAHRERLDLIGALMERVQKTDVPVAAKAEYIGNIFLDEIIDDDLAAIHTGHNMAPSGINKKTTMVPSPGKTPTGETR